MNKPNFENNFYLAELDNEGFAVIRIRLGDTYTFVKAKPVPLTKNDIYVGCEMEEDEFDREDFVNEACRINLTRFLIKGIPEINKIFDISRLIDLDKEYTFYWNGAEASWKFVWEADSNKSIDQSKLYYDDCEDEIPDLTTEDKCKNLPIVQNCYQPHVDAEGNYGDESFHAVYKLSDLRLMC